MNRRWELDALRGLMLVLMTLTHLPTRLTSPAGQPFGYVSAAEGFVFLSAAMAGLVYGRLGRRDGVGAMRTALWRRARKVYFAHATLMLFLFTVIAAIGLEINQGDVRNLMSYYLREPLSALGGGLFLVYQPPLLDILPLYVLFMLASPWLMTYGMKHGWRNIMGVSIGLWLLAQFGLGVWVHDLATTMVGLKVPVGETGAFATFAWQFLWVLGLWLGARQSKPRVAHETAPAEPAGGAIPRWAVLAALLIGMTGFAWRHVMGQAPFGADINLNLIVDKWQLGPLRMLNLFALIILTLHFGPMLARRMPRPGWLQTLGSASLPVFCAHLVMVLLVLSIWGGNQYARPWWGDVLLLAACFAGLTAVAHVTLWFDHAPVVTRRLRGLFPRAELPPPLTLDGFTEPPPPAPPKEALMSTPSPSARAPG